MSREQIVRWIRFPVALACGAGLLFEHRSQLTHELTGRRILDIVFMFVSLCLFAWRLLVVRRRPALLAAGVVAFFNAILLWFRGWLTREFNPDGQSLMEHGLSAVPVALFSGLLSFAVLAIYAELSSIGKESQGETLPKV